MLLKSTLAGHVDDAYRSSSFSEIAGASPGILTGLTHSDAAKVAEALDVRTIEELATSKYVLWAQSIVHLAHYESGKVSPGPVFGPAFSGVLDDPWKKKPLRELAKAAPSIFTALSEKQADLLTGAIQVRTIEDLATNRFVLLAQAISHLARYEKTPEPVRRAA